jgi:16S rRNA (cytosine967-C5)-methyltransferase
MSSQQQTVSPARAAAFDVLVRVEREDAYASELLHSRLLDRLSAQDCGLTMEIVMGVLRWRSRLDAAIAQYSFTPFHRLDFEVLTALRIGAYQLEFLSGIPNRAAVNESVMLVKRAKKKSAAALVNVILRKVAAGVAQRRKAMLEFEPEKANKPVRSTGPLVNRALAGENAAQFLARQYAQPEWMVTRWIAEYGISTAAQICVANQQVPQTAVRLRAAADVVETEFRESGLKLAQGGLLSSARVVVRGDVSRTAACSEGRAVIQDEGSQLIAAIVSAPIRVQGNGTPGQRPGATQDGGAIRVLDCCAAPGGKTSAIADRLPDAKIIAADLHAHRARLMRQLVCQPNIEIITADATALPVPGEFDRILADVPCSGTGTLARNPEIKWKLKPDDLADLHRRQVAILNAALDRLAPGGRLVYSTCSLEHEENEDVVEEVLRGRHVLSAPSPEGEGCGTLEIAKEGVSGTPCSRLVEAGEMLRKLAAAGELVWEDIDSLTHGPYLRTVPGVHPCDGFFAAVIERVE